MHQFRRTTTMLATTLAMSLTGCAMMDVAPEAPFDKPQLSDIEVKIPGTWWDSKRVKLEEVAAVREQKLSQEAQMVTPYSTASSSELTKSALPAAAPASPACVSEGGLVFHNVLTAGEPLPDLSPGGPANAPPPMPQVASAPVQPPVVAPVQPVASQAPVARETPKRPENERAPPLPKTVARTSVSPVAAVAPPSRLAVSTANKLPKPRLRGVVRGSHGGLVAMLEIPESGTQMAREGDTLIFAGENGQMEAFHVKHIANQQVLVRNDNNQVMVIQ